MMLRVLPHLEHTLEQALEYIADDELVEVTPHFIRMRKRILDANERKKVEKRLQRAINFQARILWLAISFSFQRPSETWAI